MLLLKITLELGGACYILERVVLPMTVPHIPALRRGRAYESLDKSDIINCRTGETVATLSQVNAGIIRKDLARMAESRAALKALPVARLIEICARGRRGSFSKAHCPSATRARRNRRNNTWKRSPPPAACRMSWCAATWPKYTTR